MFRLLETFSDFQKIFRLLENFQMFRKSLDFLWKILRWDVWPETWHSSHWLQLRTTILTTTLWPLNKEWRGQHLQFLRCFFAKPSLDISMSFAPFITTVVILRIDNFLADWGGNVKSLTVGARDNHSYKCHWLDKQHCRLDHHL